MKRVLIFILLMSMFTVFAEKEVDTIKLDGNQTSGKFKAGLSLGYPSGLTAGWRATDNFEINFLIGTNYEGFTVGISPLFTLVKFDIAEQIFPFSIGPAVNFNFIANNSNMDILAVARIEYSFLNIPLNLFLEGGAGIKINFGENVQFAGSGALGVRYIF